MKIAAHHVNKRGGVLIGDVVGLGKTLMATRARQDLRGRSRPRDADHLPEEPRPDVGGLPRPSTACGKVLSHSVVERELPELRRYRVVHHRREPQPAKPRGQALPRDSGVHPGEREQVHPAVGDAVQQDLSRPRQPAPALHPRGRRHRHPARTVCFAISARPSSSGATSAPSARSPRSRTARMPTTGAN